MYCSKESFAFPGISATVKDSATVKLYCFVNSIFLIIEIIIISYCDRKLYHRTDNNIRITVIGLLTFNIVLFLGYFDFCADFHLQFATWLRSAACSRSGAPDLPVVYVCTNCNIAAVPLYRTSTINRHAFSFYRRSQEKETGRLRRQ